MAEPPRLPAICLPWEQEVVYFVTLCVHGREQLLANTETHAAISEVARELRAWTVVAGVIMPEHLHVVVSPKDDRELSVGDFSNGLKRLLRQRLQHDWEWQRGCFDRLLRSDESFADKWAYVRENPVRAGLVAHWREWPYFFGLIEEQRLGKLTASPTAVGLDMGDCLPAQTAQHGPGDCRGSC